MCRSTSNTRHKAKEGLRGEFALCLPIAVRLLLDQKNMEKEWVEDRLACWGVGSNFGTKLVLEAIAERAAPDTPTPLLCIVA